jgi:DNA-3-methyladenine glycosylase I
MSESCTCLISGQREACPIRRRRVMCLDGRYGLDDSPGNRWGGALAGDSPAVSPLEGRKVSRQTVGRCDQRQGCLSAIEPRKTRVARLCVMAIGMKLKVRCPWAGDRPHMIRYHDREWGRPVHRDPGLFEFLLLEGAQAGLTWDTILKRRENYRKAFAGFDPAKVAKFTAVRKKQLLGNPGIIRNRLKIDAAVTNAQAFLAVQKEFGSFNRYVWQFVGGKSKLNRRRTITDVPATSPESDALSKDLKKRGFRFVGSTIIYAFMQAVGMVDDHVNGCFAKTRVDAN